MAYISDAELRSSESEYDIGSTEISESDATTSSTDQQNQVTNVLGALRRPQYSILARKRKLATNPPKGFKKCKGKRGNDPINVTPLQRVRHYPNEPFCVSNKKLFCSSCREELPIKKSSIDVHVKSSKHIHSKTKWKAKEQHDLDIAQSLTMYQSKLRTKGETLPDTTRVFRVKVLKTLLKAGIPIEKSDVLRDLMQENGYSLTHSSHLRELIPFVLEQETSKLKGEISGLPISIIFDGTTHVCEALAIVVRYMDN